MEILYSQNDNLVELDGLTNAATGAFVNTATVTLTTIRDAAGVEVSGETFPKTMNYVTASDGKYQATVDKALALTPGQAYTAVIDVAVSGIDGHWEIPAMARVRSS